jgi:hypothetical protein
MEMVLPRPRAMLLVMVGVTMMALLMVVVTVLVKKRRSKRQRRKKTRTPSRRPKAQSLSRLHPHLSSWPALLKRSLDWCPTGTSRQPDRASSSQSRRFETT